MPGSFSVLRKDCGKIDTSNRRSWPSSYDSERNIIMANTVAQMTKDELIEERYKKFRVLGKFIEANNIEEIYSEIPQKTE